MPNGGTQECGGPNGMFDKVISVEVFFPYFFWILQGRKPPCFFVCGVRVRGRGVAHLLLQVYLLIV